MIPVCDIVVIGAGAAGLAAAQRLRAAGRNVVVLEAAAHVGGRARTLLAQSFPLDLGCGWLHSADRNAWVKLAEARGFTIDRAAPPWEKQSLNVGLTPEEQAEFAAALGAMFERLEKAGQIEPDRPASDFLEPDNRWTPLIDAVSTYYNGVEWAGVSVNDFNAYVDTDVNWRVREGYGALVASCAQALTILCDCPAHEVRWDRAGVRVATARGVLEARCAVIAAPTTALASERLRFNPALPEKIDAAAALPLGAVEKVFLALAEPEMLPEEGHFFGQAKTTATGSYHLRPFGRPLIEGFFGGALAQDLSAQGAAAFLDFALEELVGLLGSDMRGKVAPLAQSHWLASPFIGGAYSHAQPGRAPARAALAAPVADKLFFAGEACSRESFSTAHGALETGRAAAEAALSALSA